MLIAIDYDKTWTADPTLWKVFYEVCKMAGHTLICVTGRSPKHPVELPNGMLAIYTNGILKEGAALMAGYEVDIWIDDTPGSIQACRVLADVEEDGL